MSDPKPKPAPAEPEPTAAMRVEACAADIRAVLEKHRCDLRAFLTRPEPVGEGGERALIGAAYAIFPRA